MTLVSVTGLNPKRNLKALEISRAGINFGEVLLLTRIVPRNSVNGIRVEMINRDLNYVEFSRFMLFELHKYVKTEFALTVHHKAWVLRPKTWTDEFLSYDYVGAPWSPHTHFTNHSTEVRVGNGGFSLRSQRIMKAPTELNLPFTDSGTGFFNEDGQICVYHRRHLEEYGVRFAPIHLAAQFSTEAIVPETDLKSFGFHNTRSAVPYFFKTTNAVRRLLA